jgi:hypothetical protein
MSLLKTRSYENIQNSYEDMLKYMTYDEVAISALMSCGGPTIYLNDVDRYNKGNIMLIEDSDSLSNFSLDPTTHEHNGVFIGCIGPRNEKKNQMERKFIIIT